jgi:trimeric autotransporter adhesin
VYDHGVWRLLVLCAACGRLGFDGLPRGGDAGGDARDAAVDALGPEQHVIVSPLIATDQFGATLAMSADGRTLAVGVQREASGTQDPADNSAPGAGAAYVFVRTGDAWTQQAYLKQPVPSAGASLGCAIGISADGATLAVGAQNVDSGAGAVEVYTRAGTAWSHQATVEATVRDAADVFGTAVALSGDGSVLVIGANLEDSAASGVNGNANDNTLGQSGAAYVFTRSGATWTQAAYLKAANPDAQDQFGTHVGVSSDGTIVAVSAPEESSASAQMPADNSLAQAGAVYVFRHTTTWAQVAFVKEPTPDAGAFFGGTLAFAASSTAFVAGAPGNDSLVANSGAAYAVHLVGDVATVDPQIKAAQPGNNDQLGTAVALAGDGSQLVAAAILADAGATDSGAAYRFTNQGGTWAQAAMLSSAAPTAMDYFGEAVAMSNDGLTFAIGDPNANGAAGAIVIYFH